MPTAEFVTEGLGEANDTYTNVIAEFRKGNI